MEKWRPSKSSCLYVVPDIHGQLRNLRLLLKQILPLRKTNEIEDHLVFLGDSIDRSELSPETVDLLIALKKKYPNQVHFIMGNHEFLLLKSFNLCKDSPTFGNALDHNFKMWTLNGGTETIQGYLRKADMDYDYYDVLGLPRFKVEIYIPKEHIEFFQNMEPYFKKDNFVFVHGGFDPSKDISKHELAELVWDRSLCRFVIKAIVGRTEADIFWDETIVTGHNGSWGPVIHDKFLMLDSPYCSQLICAEMYSQKCIVAKKPEKTVVEKDLKDVSANLSLVDL